MATLAVMPDPFFACSGQQRKKNPKLVQVFSAGQGMVDHYRRVHDRSLIEFLNLNLWGVLGSTPSSLRSQREHLIRSILELSGRRAGELPEHLMPRGHFYDFIQAFFLFRSRAPAHLVEDASAQLRDLPRVDPTNTFAGYPFWLSSTVGSNPVFAAVGKYFVSDSRSSIDVSFVSVDSEAQAGALLVALAAITELMARFDSRFADRLQAITVTGNLHPGTTDAMVRIAEINSPGLPSVVLKPF